MPKNKKRKSRHRLYDLADPYGHPMVIKVAKDDAVLIAMSATSLKSILEDAAYANQMQNTAVISKGINRIIEFLEKTSNV